MKILQEIIFSYAKVQLLDAKLVRIEVFGELVIDGKRTKELNDAIGILSKGKEILVLMMAEELTQVNEEAMAFSASEEGQRYTIADAMVVKSITQRVMANLYLSLNKPQKPSKIFNSEKDAVKWLLSLEKVRVKV
ncbi:hypothetical protein CNR22_05760 [Sphingobacteriaceae bacterium]|nr:hypothetical protein CNR22_05760 [Sphingobacteriaceae bacterium]